MNALGTTIKSFFLFLFLVTFISQSESNPYVSVNSLVERFPEPLAMSKNAYRTRMSSVQVNMNARRYWLALLSIPPACFSSLTIVLDINHVIYMPLLHMRTFLPINERCILCVGSRLSHHCYVLSTATPRNLLTIFLLFITITHLHLSRPRNRSSRGRTRGKRRGANKQISESRREVSFFSFCPFFPFSE